VVTIDGGDLLGEGGIDVDGDAGEIAVVVEFVQEEEDGLGSTEAEGGDEESALALGGFGDDAFQGALDVLGGGMNAIAIGAFGDEYVAAGDEFGVAEEGHVATPEVAGEDDAADFAFVQEFHFDDGGTENVPGVAEAEFEFGGDLLEAAVGDGLHELDDAPDVAVFVQGEDFATAGGEMLIEVEGIFLLDMSGIVEHDLGDVERGGGTEDGTVEAGFHQSRQVSAVIDMGVGEDDGIEVARVAGELFVLLPGFGAVSLEETAIEEKPELAAFDEVLTAGDLLGSPVKGDLHSRVFRLKRREAIVEGSFIPQARGG